MIEKYGSTLPNPTIPSEIALFKRLLLLFLSTILTLPACGTLEVKFDWTAVAPLSDSGEAILTATALPAWPPESIFSATPPPSDCDRAELVRDVSVPDGTAFAPNISFTKTWRIKNVGACIWTTSYKLIFFSGYNMDSPDVIILPSPVAPGESVDLSVTLTAPDTAGTYRGDWALSNASGAVFGIGPDASEPFWVEIVVRGGFSTRTPTLPAPTQPYPAGWRTYQNQEYNFSIQYPAEATLFLMDHANARFNIELPVVQGTTLSSKYVEITASRGVSSCPAMYGLLEFSENMTIGDITFLHETGTGVGPGTYVWESYSTLKVDVCVNLTFVLRYRPDGKFPTPPAGLGSFPPILDTFTWTGP